MRILMLTQLYPPFIGGIEEHVRNLSTRLAKNGHDVAVATLWREGLPEIEQDGPLRIYRLKGTVHRVTQLLFTDPQRAYAPPLPDPELVSGLRRVIRQERPHIVHAHNWLVHSFLPLKRWSKAKLVVTLHDYGLVCAKWTLIYREAACDGPGMVKCVGCAIDTYGFAKGVFTVVANWKMSLFERRMVDAFLPVSQAVAEGVGLVGSGLPYQVINNFAPDDISSAGDPLAGAGDGGQAKPAEELTSYLAQLPSEPYLLFIGAFGRHKGVDVLLRAYAALPSPPPLVMIGYRHSTYRVPLEEMPGRVILLEHWPHAAVMEAMRRSLFLIVPSVFPDPCPTVAIEAMAAGRAAVASRIGGLTDLVEHERTGLLVEADNPDALRAGLEQLLSDPSLAAKMGQAARLRFAQFQASAIVPRIERVYRDLAGMVEVKQPQDA